jgi:CHAT domain
MRRAIGAIGRMDEVEWRRLGEAALAELPEMGFDAATEAEVRRELVRALAEEAGQAMIAIRAVLTSRPELRAWLRERVGKGLRPVVEEVTAASPMVDYGPPPPPAPGATRGGRARLGGSGRSLPPPAPAPTRTVHARLEAPAAVQVEVPFPLIVGIAAAPSAGVLAPAPFQVPTGAFTLTVALLMDGFRTADGSSAVRNLESSPEVPFPAAVVDLVAIDDPAYRAARSILAVYSIDGHPLGVATRGIEVTRDVPGSRDLAAAAGASQATAARRPKVWAIPPEGAPDLQITVARGNDEAGRRLVWSAHSPHPGVNAPREPVTRQLDEEAAGDWARRVMRGVEQRRNAPDLAYYLRGVQRIVGAQVPNEIWDALASVARVVARPAVLFATAEPFIPWELARVPAPWDPSRPALLGAQVDFGRWMHDEDSEVPAPAATVRVGDIAVVKGEYTGNARLPEAEAEAAHLVRTYGAKQVAAEVSAVLACLGGQPAADIVHFAVHGRLDVTGSQDGIIMNDKSALSFESILGVESGRPQLAFLNACQVGQAQQMLGDTAGIVPSFIQIGAQGVIAPLWKVDDAVARQFAERFYAGLFAGRSAADLLAEERGRAAAADGGGSPESTVLAYLFFGHPRLTVAPRMEDAHATAGT